MIFHITLLLLPCFVHAAVPDAYDLKTAPSWSYSFLEGSGSFSEEESLPESGSLFRWILNGSEFESGRIPQLFLAHLDESLESSDGEVPYNSVSTEFVPGKFGSALLLEEGGMLVYEGAGNFSVSEGTVEFWTALRYAPEDTVYGSNPQILFGFAADHDNFLNVMQSLDTRVLYAGGKSQGLTQKATSQKACIRHRSPGEWFHVAMTFSESSNLLRLYIDGFPRGEGPYSPPGDTEGKISIGGRATGSICDYYIDEVRILDEALDAEIIAENAGRTRPFRNDEIHLDTDLLQPGDSLAFELTPCNGFEYGAPVLSESFTWNSPPLHDIAPFSMILPAGSTSLDVTIESSDPAVVRYSIGALTPFEGMTDFDDGGGTSSHYTNLPLPSSPINTHHVYFRCDLDTSYYAHRMYRVLPSSEPDYPRTFNLWGDFEDHSQENLERLSRIDLWLGVKHWTIDEMAIMRTLNPSIRILTSVNAGMSNASTDPDLLLKDVNGEPIEPWPGVYRFNMTRLDIAEMQADLAYQYAMDEEMPFDGIFFDNFYVDQSWLTEDCWGNPVQVDADEDGQPDDPDSLDAAWRAGMFHEIAEFRKLMPHALVTGHLRGTLTDQEMADYFNGESILFLTSDVIEGRNDFPLLDDRYKGWFEVGIETPITTVESAPHDQISYGYGYEPKTTAPASVCEFARTFYPRMRFGLGVTLMRDGYFAHEFGDAWHGNDWWYDELDFNLGQPAGDLFIASCKNYFPVELVENGGFEEDYIEDDWLLYVQWFTGSDATIEKDFSEPLTGEASCRVTVWDAGEGEYWHVALDQPERTITEGTRYTLNFSAKSDPPRTIRTRTCKRDSVLVNYGLFETLELSSEWQEFEFEWISLTDAGDCRVQFLLGDTTGTVWFDDISCINTVPRVFGREFENGSMYLNATEQKEDVRLGQPMVRISGDQAPKRQWIIDNGDEAFSVTGGYTLEQYDTGQWKATGPYYHDWDENCAVLDAGSEGTFDLDIFEPDDYDFHVWWAAAPEIAELSGSVSVALYAGTELLFDTTIDQTTGGDGWVFVGSAFLDSFQENSLVISSGDGPCIADGIFIESTARYNDGSEADSLVTLDPFDCVILKKATPNGNTDPPIHVRPAKKKLRNASGRIWNRVRTVRNRG